MGIKIGAAPAALQQVLATLTVIATAAAAIAAGQAAPRPLPDEPRCPRGSALVYGPPAPELFDRHVPNAGRAIWCERYDRSGEPTRVGLYTDAHPSGAARSRARFEDDVLDGELLILHENGGVWLRTQYDGGRVEGRYEMFAPDGTPWLEASFADGVPHGRHVLFHPDGSPASETHYERGVEHGLARAWWPSGAVRHEISVVRGVWSGDFATWFENGRPRSAGQYAACPEDEGPPSCLHIGAARHGRWRTWHENGERASQGSFEYGRKVGTWVYWDEEGHPDSVSVHREGDVVRAIRGRMPAAPAPVSAEPPEPPGAHVAP